MQMSNTKIKFRRFVKSTTQDMRHQQAAAGEECEVARRSNCGMAGIGPRACMGKGCCWAPVKPNPKNLPWCHFKTRSRFPHLPADVQVVVWNGETVYSRQSARAAHSRGRSASWTVIANISHHHSNALPSDAAYVFALVDWTCSPQHRTQLFASISTLQRTAPLFDIVALLGSACWSDERLRGALVKRNVVPVRAAEVLEHVPCKGPHLAPGSRVSANQSTSGYFDQTYGILSAWNLTQYEVVWYLDSDIAVLRSLDSVMHAMLRNEAIGEARTPQGCLAADDSMRKFNGGVWAMRPSARIFGWLVEWLLAGKSTCGVGVQTVGEGENNLSPAKTALHPHLSHSFWTHSSTLHPALGAEFFNRAHIRTHAGGLMLLHTGFNMKADLGVNDCAVRHQLRGDDIKLIHWSGTRKPQGLVTTRLEAHEARAHRLYMDEYCQWATKSWPSCPAQAARELLLVRGR